MKIIGLHKRKIDQHIESLKKGDRKAQAKVYKLLAPKMLSVCNQYVQDIHYAEDVMVKGFLKVFTQISKYQQTGSFEGWIRRIMVNESISFLRAKMPLNYLEDQEFLEPEVFSDCDVSMEDLELLIQALPDGCRTVFTLYVVEGYKHLEIAKLLAITEGTSKSQLSQARKLLQQQLLKLKAKGVWNGVR